MFHTDAWLELSKLEKPEVATKPEMLCGHVFIACLIVALIVLSLCFSLTHWSRHKTRLQHVHALTPKVWDTKFKMIHQWIKFANTVCLHENVSTVCLHMFISLIDTTTASARSEKVDVFELIGRVMPLWAKQVKYVPTLHC